MEKTKTPSKNTQMLSNLLAVGLANQGQVLAESKVNKFDIAEAATAPSTTPAIAESPVVGKEEKPVSVVIEKSPKKQSSSKLDSSSGQVVEISLSKLHDNPYNARTVYDHEIIKERASSITANGQKTPILIAPMDSKPGHYYIVDGHYRKQAIQFLGKDTIIAYIDNTIKSNEDLYKISFITNDSRESQTTIDNAVVWKRLLDEKVFKNDIHLSDSLQLSKGTISKTLSVLTLPAPILEGIKEFPQDYKLSTLYELHLFYKKHENLKELLKLFNQIKDEQMSRQQVQQYIKNFDNKLNRKQRQTSRLSKLLLGDSQLGSMKEWGGSGRVQLEMNIKDEKIKNQFIEHIKKFVAIK